MIFIPIPFRERDFKIKQEPNGTYIWDIIRMKYIFLTPEEWVRQHLIHALIEDMKIPKSLIAVEKMITVGRLKKRFDLLIYDHAHNPIMIVECKESNTSLSTDTMYQLLRYQSTIQANYLMVTNGKLTILGEVRNGALLFLESFPTL